MRPALFGEVMALVWDETTFALAYSRPYGLQWIEEVNYAPVLADLQKLDARIGASLGSKFLVAGCGFGFMLPKMVELGATFANVWGCDTSPYIHANKATQAPAGYASRILNIDILAGPTAFRNDIGGNGKVAWVISEYVLTSLQTDQEIENFRVACTNMQSGGTGGVIHLFASEHPKSDRSFGMNWQPREYWSARMPDQWLYDVRGGVWNPQQGAWQ